MVHLSGSWMRPEGSDPLRTGMLIPVPPLLRSRLLEPAGERDEPCSSPGAGDPGEPRREREHEEPLPEKPKGMRWITCERLWWEHHEAEMEQVAGMREWLDKLEKKVG
jgi:hypothetical protein